MMASDHFVKYALEFPMAVAPGTEFADANESFPRQTVQGSSVSGCN